MKWKVCGKYIDRIVRIIGLRSLGEFIENDSLAFSQLFLCFENCSTSRDEIHIFLDKVVPLSPLAIVMAGNCAAVYFDELLNYLGTRSGQLQIMTGVNESTQIDDWKIDFLQAKWPAEERFDCWKEYAIIVIGDIIFQERVYSEFIIK